MPPGVKRPASALSGNDKSDDVLKFSCGSEWKARASLVKHNQNSSFEIVPSGVLCESDVSGPRAPSPSASSDSANDSPSELDVHRGSSPRSVAPGTSAASSSAASESLMGVVAEELLKLQRRIPSVSPRSPTAVLQASPKYEPQSPLAPAPLPPSPLSSPMSSVEDGKPSTREVPLPPPPPPRALVGGVGEALRCLVLDNDETTGYYQLISLLYSIYMHLTGAPPPRAVILAQLSAGAARPGTVELLQLAHRLKQQGRVDHVVVWTAASDTTGWVRFLVSCLEEFAGVPRGTVGAVLCREDVLPAGMPGQVIKDLRRVCGDASRVVIVDDKPQFVRHGTCLAVAPYEQHVPIAPWVEAMAPKVSAESLELARNALRDDAAANKAPSSNDFSADRALFDLLGPIEALFP